MKGIKKPDNKCQALKSGTYRGRYIRLPDYPLESETELVQTSAGS